MIQKKRKFGFTLVEVIVASMVFVVVFTGLAGIFQAGVLLSKASDGGELCRRNFRDGMRLIREGDSWSPGVLNSPQLGLLAADQALITGGPMPQRGRLQYLTNGIWYEVWSANGTLLRRQVLPVLAPPWNQPKIIMGDPTNHILVVPETYVPTRVPQVINVAAIFQTGTKALIQFSFQLHHDIDGNYLDGVNPGLHIPSPGEYVSSYSSSIFLRNSEF